MKGDSAAETAWSDQHDAAVADAENLLGTMATAHGGTGRRSSLESNDSPFHTTFLGRQFGWLESETSFRSAGLRSCRHVSPSRPSVWFVNLHEPKRVLCAKCALKEAEQDADARPDVCDSCSASGVSKFHEVAVQTGNFVVVGNICPECYSVQRAESA